MRFDGRSVAKITAEDIEQLVCNKEREDGSLDFKREMYSSKDADKKEFLHDVTSFANADGGYIIIGIDEIKSCASGWYHIEHAEEEVNRLKDMCLQSISPRIRDLEIVVKPIPSQSIDIVLIHIPESATRPHMVTFKDGTHFCRRYHDRKRSMSIEELQEVFSKRNTIQQTGTFNNLQSDINKLYSILSVNRLSDLQPTESIQNALDTAEVRKIMDLRFRNKIGTSPYFRITVTPMNTSFVDLRNNATELTKLLSNPPQTRPSGWVIYPTTQIKQYSEGWQAISPNDRAIFMLNNGHLEYWHSCNDILFQWGRQTTKQSTPELYPYAVCELPVNFTRLAKAVYSMSELTEKIVFKLEYINIHGFVLRPGVPDSIAYMMPSSFVETGGYAEDSIATADEIVPADFDPDPVAFRLVEQIYSAFGIPRKYIPCFENGQRFDINVNSSE